MSILITHFEGAMYNPKHVKNYLNVLIQILMVGYKEFMYEMNLNSLG